LVYPEGGILDTAGVHRTRDEGIGLRVLKQNASARQRRA